MAVYNRNILGLHNSICVTMHRCQTIWKLIHFILSVLWTLSR